MSVSPSTGSNSQGVTPASIPYPESPSSTSNSPQPTMHPKPNNAAQSSPPSEDHSKPEDQTSSPSATENKQDNKKPEQNKEDLDWGVYLFEKGVCYGLTFLLVGTQYAEACKNLIQTYITTPIANHSPALISREVAIQKGLICSPTNTTETPPIIYNVFSSVVRTAEDNLSGLSHIISKLAFIKNYDTLGLISTVGSITEGLGNVMKVAQFTLLWQFNSLCIQKMMPKNANGMVVQMIGNVVAIPISTFLYGFVTDSSYAELGDVGYTIATIFTCHYIGMVFCKLASKAYGKSITPQKSAQ